MMPNGRLSEATLPLKILFQGLKCIGSNVPPNIYSMLQLHWSTRMQELVQHRKDWDIHFSHIPMLHRTLASRTEQHRWILHTYLSGKTGTFDLLSKYIAEIDGSCPFCKQADSKEHRLFHCSAFQEVRSKHQCIVNKFKKKTYCYKGARFPDHPKACLV